MEDTILAITADMHARLSRLMACERFGAPPRRLQQREPHFTLLGKATKEQQAIALLYGQVQAEHERMHRSERIPMGVNPKVSFAHYRNHVLRPILFEVLGWSVHRAFPGESSDRVRFDNEWNVYTEPVPREQNED